MNNPSFPSFVIRQRRVAAFSLMELLVVISIIAVLAGLLVATAGFINEKAGTSRAEGEISALNLALENYKLEYGTYPEGDGKDNSTKVLIEKLAIEPIRDNRKPFFEFPTKMLDGYSNGDSTLTALDQAKYLVDPFGNPYHYEFQEDAPNSERSGKGNFNLWSQGKKGDSNTREETWIKNW
jgi:prepilin-type N-terminal cleavage/methylation domain-containing protein